jgi:uncharacterized protein YjlB
MSKTTQKTAKPVENKKQFKMPNWSTVWKESVLAFFTAITFIKVIGVGSAAAYLITTGMSKTDVVYIGLGSILAGYAIIVFVSVAHIATKSRRA